MSYLSQPSSTTDYGLVVVGSHINVNDGIISLDQDLSPIANVSFNSVDAAEITVDGSNVVTSVTPSAGDGIQISSLNSTGYDVTFTVINTGVLSLTAGPGISLSNSTGNITVSSIGADLIAVKGVTSSYTATLNDEYIGVFSANAVTITLPTGVDGRVYIIKDEYGRDGGKITVQPQPSESIDNKKNYIISVANQSVQVVFRAGQWRII